MQDFRKRRATRGDWLRMARGCAVVAVLALVAFWAVRGAWGMYQKFADASQADADAHQELSDLEGQYQKVSAAAEALGSERGVEAGLRQRYGVAKPGEGEIDIIRTSTTTTPLDQGSQNIFVRIFRAIFVW